MQADEINTGILKLFLIGSVRSLDGVTRIEFVS